MAWAALDSSNLEAFDYDADMRVLHVRFHGGRIYSYADVPGSVAQELAAADSPGRYFASIKGRYRAL